MSAPPRRQKVAREERLCASLRWLFVQRRRECVFAAVAAAYLA
jgi:hypothetical protein